MRAGPPPFSHPYQKLRDFKYLWIRRVKGGLGTQTPCHRIDTKDPSEFNDLNFPRTRRLDPSWPHPYNPKPAALTERRHPSNNAPTRIALVPWANRPPADGPIDRLAESADLYASAPVANSHDQREKHNDFMHLWDLSTGGKAVGKAQLSAHTGSRRRRTLSELWSRVLREIRTKVGDRTFDTWFAPLELSAIDDTTVELAVPNRFFQEWFENNYLDEVRATMSKLSGQAFRVVLGVSTQSETIAPRKAVTPSADEAPKAKPAPTPSAKPRGLNPRYTFDNFVTGSSNELAASAAHAVAEDPGQRFNPLFIYGGVGLGKTHLLHGIGSALHRRHPHMRISYISAEHFMNEFVNAVRNNAFEAFRRRYRNDTDCLLVDDIQFIAGKDRTMDEFFHVFNALHEAGKQIVITADRVPSDMEGMEARLTSRLNWGLVADVQAPDLETRMAILEHKAERDGVALPRPVAQSIAQLVDSNVRDLEGALVRVTAFADLRGARLDEAFVREALGGRASVRPPPVTVERVQKAVASHFRVRIADLKGRRRHQAIARPRMIAMYLSRELSGASFPEIGMRFGGRDHSTVISACRRIESISGDDPDFRETVAALRERLTMS